MTTNTVTQTLTLPGDILVANTTSDSSLSATVTGSNAGATVLIEGSTDGVNWSTLNTITAAGSYPIAYGLNPLVRARCTVQGAAAFVVSLVGVLAPAGFTVLGQSSAVVVAPTVTAGAYSAGNVVGGLLTFANVFGPAFSGRLTDFLVKSKSVQTTTYKLYLFNQQPTNSTWTDKAAPAINALDLPFLLGVWTSGASDSGLGTETSNQLDNINAIIRSSNQNLYAILVCVATPTYASTSDITVEVRTRKD